MARETMHYHKVDPQTQLMMSAVRERFIELDEFLSIQLPDCRSKSICLEYLENSSMRAIQAISVTYGEKIEKGE